jgi:hypothetical protein
MIVVALSRTVKENLYRRNVSVCELKALKQSKLRRNELRMKSFDSKTKM